MIVVQVSIKIIIDDSQNIKYYLRRNLVIERGHKPIGLVLDQFGGRKSAHFTW